MRWLGLAVFLTYRMLRTLAKIVSGLVVVLLVGVLVSAALEALEPALNEWAAWTWILSFCLLSACAFVILWNRVALRLNRNWTPERSETWSRRLGLPPGTLDADVGERPGASTVIARMLSLPALPRVVRVAGRIIAAGLVIAFVVGGVEFARIYGMVSRNGACMEKGGSWNEEERRCYYPPDRCAELPAAIRVDASAGSGCYVPM